MVHHLAPRQVAQAIESVVEASLARPPQAGEVGPSEPDARDLPMAA
jgi:hypothetical protein